MTEAKTEPPSDREEHLPVAVFQALDRLDEDQTIQREITKMKGQELLPTLVYDTVIDGHRVTALSIAGVQECIRRRGNVAISQPPQLQIDEKEVHAIIVKKDLIRNLEVTGTASCEKTKPFAWTLAMNKAERNADRKLLPEKLIAEMIREFLEHRNPPRGASKIEFGGPISKPIEGTTTQPEAPTPARQNPEITGHEETQPTVLELNSLNAVTEEGMITELDKLTWRENTRGHKGWNVRVTDLPQPYRGWLAFKLYELKTGSYLTLGEHSYRRFGDNGEWLAKYPARKEQQRTQPPIEKIQTSPEESRWTLPVTTEAIQGGERIILKAKGGVALGASCLKGEEFITAPARPFSLTDATVVQNFLVPKVLGSIKTKLANATPPLKFEYELEAQDGLLVAVRARPVDADHFREITNAVRWTFAAALKVN